jgi:uncharacterized protein YhaN
MDARSRYNFLHPYPAMRIGGDIEINGISRRFFRIKRPKNSLLDSGDKPIAERAILGELGGIDRISYMAMFSLDDDTLVEGGESILASKGDLGQLLFAASAGLSDLSQKLAGLGAEADEFRKLRGRGGNLSDLKGRLAELKKQREEIDTAASAYAKLVEERDGAAVRYDEAMRERSRIQSRLEELRRQLNALPRLVALRGFRERIRPLADIPDAPFGWRAELPQLLDDDIELATRANGVEGEIAKISEALDGIIIDERILERGERIDRLAILRAQYMTADKDIPERRLQQHEAELAVLGIVRRMECDPEADAASLLLGAPTMGALRDLMEARSGVETGAATAENELAEARRRLTESQAKLKGAGAEQRSDKPAAIAPLASVLSLARADDHAARGRLAERAREEQLATLTKFRLALRPWTGEVQELLDLSVPDADSIGRWKNSALAAERRVERCSQEIARLEAERRRLMTEMDTADQVDGVVSDQEAAKIRAAREEAWASHKRILEAQSAEAFEAILRRDDIVTSSRIGKAAEVANLHQIAKRLAQINGDLTAARADQDAAAKELADVQAEIGAAIRTMARSLPQDWSLPKLEAWLQSRTKALEALEAVRKEERNLRAAEQDGKTIRHKLMAAASVAGIDCPADVRIDSLVSLLQAAIDQENELKALRLQVAERRRNVEARERGAQTAKDAERAWDESWAKLCSNCWLGKNGTIPTVPMTREVLKALDELGPLLEQRAGLIDRIRKMESDQHRFAAEVVELTGALDLDITRPPLDLAAELAKAVEKARTAEAARKDALKRLKDAEARRQGIVEAKAIHDVRKAEMIGHLKVESLKDVDKKLRDLEIRKGLEDQAAAAEREMLDALGMTSIERAEELLDHVDRSAAEAAIAELAARFDDHDKRSRELFSESSKASDRLEAVGGDDAVARIEARRRTILLEIEEGAKRHLGLRLGITAAEQALRIYRNQHRSSMMARASDAFRIISRGAYKGLATQPDKDSEVLVAVAANDGSKVASDLSKGTRFQLYLALRVAGYHEFAQSHRSVPFIADDIMETFDDFRAEEAFKLFAEMARVGQVIYLTHHQHLCEIARRVCPGVVIHELGADGARTSLPIAQAV